MSVFHFQHAVLLFTQGICSFIPDTPGSVRLQIQRENLLQRENLFKEQKRQIKDEAKGRWRTAGEEVAVVRVTVDLGYCDYIPWDQGKIVTTSDICHKAITSLECALQRHENGLETLRHREVESRSDVTVEDAGYT